MVSDVNDFPKNPAIPSSQVVSGGSGVVKSGASGGDDENIIEEEQKIAGQEELEAEEVETEDEDEEIKKQELKAAEAAAAVATGEAAQPVTPIQLVQNVATGKAVPAVGGKPCIPHAPGNGSAIKI